MSPVEDIIQVEFNQDETLTIGIVFSSFIAALDEQGTLRMLPPEMKRAMRDISLKIMAAIESQKETDWDNIPGM